MANKNLIDKKIEFKQPSIPSNNTGFDGFLNKICS